MIQKMKPEDIPAHFKKEDSEITATESSTEEVVATEKTLLEKEKSRFQKALNILTTAQSDSVENDFNEATLTYPDLEFLISTLKLGYSRSDTLLQISNGVNKKSDEISNLLEKISKGLPKINIS